MQSQISVRGKSSDVEIRSGRSGQRRGKHSELRRTFSTAAAKNLDVESLSVFLSDRMPVRLSVELKLTAAKLFKTRSVLDFVMTEEEVAH